VPESHAREEASDDDCLRRFEATHEEFERAFRVRELDSMMATYHDDVTVVLPDGRSLMTRPEVRAHFKNLFTDTTWTASFTPVRTVVSGCRGAVVVNDVVFEMPSRGYTRRFVNTLTYVHEDGRWQVIVDQSTLAPT